jgi:hypothetical protein
MFVGLVHRTATKKVSNSSFGEGQINKPLCLHEMAAKMTLLPGVISQLVNKICIILT